MEEHTDPFEVRLAKLRRLRELGINPYPPCFRRTHHARTIHEQFSRLEAGEVVTVAGRLRSLRPMGKVVFGHIEDETGRVQLYLRRDDLGDDAYQIVPLLDLGDLIGASGQAFRTRTGEISVRVSQLSMLAKSLRPMPVVKEKDGVVFDPFHDREARYRRRYLDLMVNPATRDLFRLRAAAIRALRRHLDEAGFLEVETPVLQAVYGGAAARPFRTHHQALDEDLYLRIAEELPLKKLLVGGFERVYEIGRVFRNEGIDRHHNPEFTLLEFYWAYADYHDAMVFVEELLRAVAHEVTGGLVLTVGVPESSAGASPAPVQSAERIDLAPPFARRSMLDLIHEATGVDPLRMSVAQLQNLCADLGAQVSPPLVPGRLIDKIFDVAVAPHLRQPTFVMDHLRAISPLAKAHRERPGELVERFELFIAGQEFANAFSELNDPEDQRRRFSEQAGLREAGDEEAHPSDEGFLEALEHGMPPAAGVGIGVDRLVMLLTGAPALKDVLLFPHMRQLTEGPLDNTPQANPDEVGR